MEAADHPLNAGRLGTSSDRGGEGGRVTSSETKRALNLYELALSLVETTGVPITLGVTTIKEYRTEVLTIHYLPRSGHLDVWHRRKVLTIDRWRGPPEVTHYVRGEDWEDALKEAAK